MNSKMSGDNMQYIMIIVKCHVTEVRSWDDKKFNQLKKPITLTT